MANFNDIHDVLINRCGLSPNFFSESWNLAIVKSSAVELLRTKRAIGKRVVLGTGRLTIARAIVFFFFVWTRFGKLNFENFQRKKKKEYCRD